MVIQALCEYYDILAQKGEVLKDGYSNEKAHYLIELSESGELARITDYKVAAELTQKNGKVKTVYNPRDIVLPKRTEKTAVDFNIVEHRPLYIFGLIDIKEKDENTGETKTRFIHLDKNLDKTEKAKKSHDIFVKTNLEFVAGLDSEVVNAYRLFMQNWQPENETENPHLLQIMKEYSTVKFAFCLEGRPDLLLHEDENLLAKWREQFANQVKDGVQAQCCVTGEVSNIARIHSKIKGVNGANSTGAGLVAFKESAYESYGNEQSYNSNISETAMKKYTEALNYLLSKSEHKSSLDDITVVHFAMSKNNKNNDVMKSLIFEGFSLTAQSEKMGEKSTNSWVKSILQHSNSGSLNTENFAGIEEIDPNVEFYMIGIKPNSSRLCVKFCYKQKIGKLLLNITQHQNDLQISDEFKPMSLWQLKQELISPNSSKETLNPALSAKLFDAILYGYNYPDFLLQTVIRRIKVDSDTETNSFIKINPRRIGIIKASINRKSRNSNKQEEITMALNEQNTNPAYLCGRLFAVLEKVQQDASGGNLNRTIKDTYFSSASSRPRIIFPKLMRLSEFHLSKIEYKTYYVKLMGSIIDLLEENFPDSLPLQEQGKFIVGYYQQNKLLYTKTKEEN